MKTVLSPFLRGLIRLSALGLISILELSLSGCSSIPFGMNSFGANAVDDKSYSPGSDVAEQISKQDLAAGKLPEGTYDKAPVGAFEHRDYSHVKLDPHVALKLINKYRKSKGLGSVVIDPQLTNTAKSHSRDLAKHDRISHYGSDGSNPWDRVERSGYKPQLAAENVGTGQLSMKEVMQGWKDSPGHNKNLLLPDARDIGIALVYDPKTEYKTFWTLILGKKI